MNKAGINKNATYSIIKNVFAFIFPLITFPYSSRVIGAENMGKLDFGNSIVGYVGLIASLGVTAYAVRECAAVKSDKDKLSEVSSQIFSINIVSTIIAFIALAVALIVAPQLRSYRFLIIVQSMTVFFTIMGTEWLNTAMSDFKFITIRTVLFQVISVILMFIFVRDSGDYMIYAYINLFSAAGTNIMNMFYRRKYCRVRLTRDMQIKRHFKPIMMLFSLIIVQTVFVSTDVTILGIVKGDFQVGLYSASTRIYTMVNTVVSSLAWVVMPEMSELFVNKDYERINGLLKYTLNIILALGLPCVVGLNLLADELILTLAGGEYIGAVPSLRILTVSLAFSFAAGFIGNIILLPSKKENIMLISSLVSAAVNLILNLIFIPMFGLYAAAATTALSNAIGFFFGIPFVDKAIKLKGIRKMIICPIVGVAGMSGIVMLVKLIPLNPITTAIVGMVSGAIVYFGIMLLLKDEFVTQYFNQAVNKLKAIVGRRKR